nr:MAG TPA: hypothetical protein [Caudoviricetes sp.]
MPFNCLVYSEVCNSITEVTNCVIIRIATPNAEQFFSFFKHKFEFL